MKIRRGEGRFWSMVKQFAKSIVRLHVPVVPLNKPIFSVLYLIHVGIRFLVLNILRVVWFQPLFSSQCVAVGPNFRMEQLVFLQGLGRIIIGSDVHLSGKSNIGFCNSVFERPVLEIGNSTFLGHDCSIYVAQSVHIGRNCLIAGGVIIRDYDGHPLDYLSRRNGMPILKSSIKTVSIGDDVWIGARAVILKGTSIGNRSIVAASSVVTKDVPPDSIVAGNPARIVKKMGASEKTSCHDD
ncbi:acyltransferase [Bythopirellula goksoeyrii]